MPVWATASPDLNFHEHPTLFFGTSSNLPLPLSHDSEIGKALILYDLNKSDASVARKLKNTDAEVALLFDNAGISPSVIDCANDVISDPKSKNILVLVVLA